MYVIYYLWWLCCGECALLYFFPFFTCGVVVFSSLVLALQISCGIITAISATNVAEGGVESEVMKEESITSGDKAMPWDEEKDQNVEFLIDLPIPTWRCVQMFRGHNAKAIIPEGTLGAAVVPSLQPPRSTYAIAANMLDVGFGNVTRADCLTLFPPGENWVHLGLEAYGLDEYPTTREYGREDEEEFFPASSMMMPFTSDSNLSLGDECANRQVIIAHAI